MIITCEHCKTQFRLDDARVPQNGVRVRCSRCHHAFFVDSPEVARRRHIDAVAGEAARRAAPAPAGAADEGELESEWEFNADLPSGEAETESFRDLGDELGLESDPARDAVDDLLDAPHPEGSPGEALDEDVETPAGTDAASSSFVPDLEPERPFEAADVSDDLGRPAEWDFFANAERAGGDAEGTSPDFRHALPDDAITREDLRADRPQADPVGVEVPSELDVPTHAPWLRRASEIGGWTATLLLVVLGLHRGLVAQPEEGAVAATRAPAGMALASVEGRWLENQRLGTLYVVSGLARRTDREAPLGALVVRLVDEAGDPIEDHLAYVGPALPTRVLRLGDPEALRLHQQRYAAPFAEALPPLRERRFHAILTEVPPRAAGFRIVPAPAAPTSPAAEL